MTRIVVIAMLVATAYAGVFKTATARADGACAAGVPSKASFMQAQEKIVSKVFVLSKAAQGKMTAFYKSLPGYEFPADAVTYVGMLHDGRTGLVSFSKGCGVARSIEAFPNEVFARLMQTIGIVPGHLEPYVIGGDI